METIRDTSIYQHFKKKATPEQLELVDKHVQSAANSLKLIMETFPTYTLHDEVHAINVVVLMGKLLGEKNVKKLCALECAILILSAYYHDIGMVFTKEEREQIEDEVDFDKFLLEKTEAKIKLERFRKKSEDNKDKVPDEIAEWFCRWIHPDRALYKLRDMEDISWNGQRINEELGDVCKSHGDSLEDVRNNLEDLCEFNEGADLFLCAILLRLADILDFDNSRSPSPIYKHLNLKEGKTDEEKVSNAEWRKHDGSQGFIFSPLNEKGEYSVKFIATLTEPKVESDVRAFLEIIEKELAICNKLKKACSPKWKDIFLPVDINKSEIKSQGYHYGEFRFSLEQEHVLNLLMGENLYSDKYAFIRELAQNAIDTTRHREIYEKNQGNTRFQTQPIKFSTWSDEDGYKWIRIDDYGLGMDEDIILRFFLKIGQSYYSSSQFELEQLDWKEEDKDFMPISRFGIGILSCFIMGDRIELSTKRVTDSPQRNSIRLSMGELEGFFVIKKEEQGHVPENMPNENRTAEKYRKNKEYGTSIAIRINPKKENVSFDLKKKLEEYIKTPPVPVVFDGENIGGDYEKLIEKKWCEYKEYPIKEVDIKRIEKALDMKFTTLPVFLQIPLDLTANSPFPDKFKGQATLFYLNMDDADRWIINKRTDDIHRMIQYDWTDDDQFLINFYCSKASESKDEYLYIEEYVDENKDSSFLIKTQPAGTSHNGIAIPDRFDIGNPELGYIFYKLAFKDNLRFNLSVSRDIIKSISWNIFSTVYYTFLKALMQIKHESIFEDWLIIDNHYHLKDNLLEVIMGDPLILQDNYWQSIPLFYLEDKKTYVSVKELRKKELEFNFSYYISSYSYSFMNLCKYTLIQTGLNIEFDAESGKTRVLDIDKPVIEEWEKHYTPLCFINYVNDKPLRKGHNPINKKHPFASWLIKNTEILDTRYPAILSEMIQECSSSSWIYGDSDKREKGIKNIVEKVNTILDRLKVLNYEDKPTAKIYLKESDFEV